MLRHFYTVAVGSFAMVGLPIAAICLLLAVMNWMMGTSADPFPTVAFWIVLIYVVASLPMHYARYRGNRAMRSAAQEWAKENDIDPDTLGPWVLSGSARTGFVFLDSDAVVLISLEGQRYIHRFNVDDLVWETKANARGITAGLVSADIWPPADSAPRHGCVKIRHMGHIPGEVTGRLKHAGINA